jgi:hypothetical protein
MYFLFFDPEFVLVGVGWGFTLCHSKGVVYLHHSNEGLS